MRLLERNLSRWLLIVSMVFGSLFEVEATTVVIIPKDCEGVPIWEHFITISKNLIKDELIFSEVKDYRQYLDSGYNFLTFSANISFNSKSKLSNGTFILFDIYNRNDVFNRECQPTLNLLEAYPNKDTTAKGFNYKLRYSHILPLKTLSTTFNWKKIYDGKVDMANYIKYWSPNYVTFLLKSVLNNRFDSTITFVKDARNLKYAKGYFSFYTSQVTVSKIIGNKPVYINGRFKNVDSYKSIFTGKRVYPYSSYIKRMNTGSRIVFDEYMGQIIESGKSEFLFVYHDENFQRLMIFDFQTGYLLGFFETSKSYFPLDWVLENLLDEFPFIKKPRK